MQDGKVSTQQGSSPRMRGAPVRDDGALHVPGIIPADAGSTGLVAAGGGHFEDHPRGCGEHARALRSPCRMEGSSPRMRGAPCRYTAGYRYGGIIPADAGSTRPLPRLGEHVEDHPRGCGEHTAPRFRTGSFPGSSPRMRGAPIRHKTRTDHCRIIPADAGSTHGRRGRNCF